MTKEQLWDAYVAKNPSFAKGGNVTMSTVGLKKLFEQTWNMAHDAGGRQNAAMFDGFADIFGGRKST